MNTLRVKLERRRLKRQTWIDDTFVKENCPRRSSNSLPSRMRRKCLSQSWDGGLDKLDSDSTVYPDDSFRVKLLVLKVVTCTVECHLLYVGHECQ